MTKDQFLKRGRQLVDRHQMWLTPRTFLIISDFVATAAAEMGGTHEKPDLTDQEWLNAARDARRLFIGGELFKKSELNHARDFLNRIEEGIQRDRERPAPDTTQDREDV